MFGNSLFVLIFSDAVMRCKVMSFVLMQLEIREVLPPSPPRTLPPSPPRTSPTLSFCTDEYPDLNDRWGLAGHDDLV